VEAAEKRIRPYLPPTPLYEATSLSAHVGRPVFAKLESMNPTGAFKVRGAFNFLLSLTPEQRELGVVAASGGSHGLGISHVARRLGIRADVYLPNQWASPAKVAKVKRLNERVHMVGTTYREAHAAALEHAEKTGQPYIHAFADARVMAGQGTIGLEILAQLPEVSTVIVPVGGGGLISGITVAVKSLRPDVRMVAVEAKAAEALTNSLADGIWYEKVEVEPSIAGGLAGGIGRDVLNLAEAGLINDAFALPEPAIERALVWIYHEEQWMVEGAAAISVAAVIENLIDGEGPVCCVISGANITLEALLPVFASALADRS
jgi:threonine dehydratase